MRSFFEPRYLGPLLGLQNFLSQVENGIFKTKLEEKIQLYWPRGALMFFFWKTKNFENRSLFDNFLTAYNVGWKFNHVVFEKGQVQGFRRTINHIDTTPTAFWISIQTLAVFTKNTFFAIIRKFKKIFENHCHVETSWFFLRYSGTCETDGAKKTFS